MPKSPDGDLGLHGIQMSLNGSSSVTMVIRRDTKLISDIQPVRQSHSELGRGGITQGWHGTPSLAVKHFIKSNIKL